jgi:hypothetical protein
MESRPQKFSCRIYDFCGARAGADRNIYGSATPVFTARLYKNTGTKTVCVGYLETNREPKFDIENPHIYLVYTSKNRTVCSLQCTYL